MQDERVISARDLMMVAMCASALIALPLVCVQGALAAPSGCAVFCGKTSFTSGPAHASCLQACRQCGGDVSRVCQGPTGSICCASGTSCCSGPSGATCCSSGTVCTENGECVVPRAFCIPTCADTC